MTGTGPRHAGRPAPAGAGVVPTAPAVHAVADRLRAAGCVFAEDEARVILASAPTAADVEALVARRVGGTPLEVVVGWASFGGLRIEVDPGVFVPRRRSELLVSQAAARSGPGAVVVDLCAGTGAIGLAVAHAAPDIDLHVADLDPAAVACAHRNLAGRGQVHEGDLFEALPRALQGRVDVLAVNAPYVPSAEVALLPREAREHEHLVALDGGTDGLDVQRRVAAEAPAWLAPGGHLLVETGEHQLDRTIGLLRGAGLVAESVRDEDLGATVAIGTRPTRSGPGPDQPGGDHRNR